MRALVLIAVCLLGSGCATRPSGYFEAIATVADAERDMSLYPRVSLKTETLKISLYFAGKGSVYSMLSVTSNIGAVPDDSVLVPFQVSYGERFVLLGFSRTKVRIGGNVFGRAITLRWTGSDVLTVGNVVFRKQNELNQVPTRENGT